jgi:hypothetical protein
MEDWWAAVPNPIQVRHSNCALSCYSVHLILNVQLAWSRSCARLAVSRTYEIVGTLTATAIVTALTAMLPSHACGAVTAGAMYG